MPPTTANAREMLEPGPTTVFPLNSTPDCVPEPCATVKAAFPPQLQGPLVQEQLSGARSARLTPLFRKESKDPPPSTNRASVKLLTVLSRKVRLDPPFFTAHTSRPELASGGFLTTVTPDNGTKLRSAIVMVFLPSEQKTLRVPGLPGGWAQNVVVVSGSMFVPA